MDRPLKTLDYPVPNNLARKQQTTSETEMHFLGVRQSWAIAQCV
jgi:hypothetical protein